MFLCICVVHQSHTNFQNISEGEVSLTLECLVLCVGSGLCFLERRIPYADSQGRGRVPTGDAHSACDMSEEGDGASALVM